MADQGMQGSHPVDLTKHPSEIVPTLHVSLAIFVWEPNVHTIRLTTCSYAKRREMFMHHIEKSKGTLQFASRAKRITNCAQVNEVCIGVIGSYDRRLLETERRGFYNKKQIDGTKS